MLYHTISYYTTLLYSILDYATLYYLEDPVWGLTLGSYIYEVRCKPRMTKKLGGAL